VIEAKVICVMARGVSSKGKIGSSVGRRNVKNEEQRERKGRGQKGKKEKGDPGNGNYHSQ
jgi:hypothetical protein